MKLSNNFTLEEFTRSSTAKRLKIDNIPNEEQIANIKKLVKCLLQPLRDAYKKTMTVSSGFRCPALNEAVGGSKTSDHPNGKAADIVCESARELLALLLELKLSFDQAIVYDDGKNHFLHLSFRSNSTNRKQVLYSKNTKR
jgi:Peptidase M15.